MSRFASLLRQKKACVDDPFSRSTRYCFPSENRRIRKRVRKLATKEPGTVAWLNEDVQSDDMVLDIGANIGLYSVFAAARVPAGRVYSFEPHAATFSILIKAIMLNGMADRITPLSVALDSEPGFVKFGYRDLVPGSTGSQLATSPMIGAIDQEVSEIKAVTSVDALVDAGVILPPDIVKIDVDGNELRILQGMSNTLSSNGPRAVQVEVDPSLNSDIVNFMRERQYIVEREHYTMAGQRRIDRGEDPSTYLHNIIFKKQ